MTDFSKMTEGAIFEGVKTALSPLTALGKFFLTPRARMGMDLMDELEQLNESVAQGVERERAGIRLPSSIQSGTPTQQAISAPGAAVSAAAQAPPEIDVRRRLTREALAKASPLLQVSKPGLALRALTESNRALEDQKTLRGNLEKSFGSNPGAFAGLSDDTLQLMARSLAEIETSGLKSQKTAKSLQKGTKSVIDAIKPKAQKQEVPETPNRVTIPPQRNPFEMFQEFFDEEGNVIESIGTDPDLPQTVAPQEALQSQAAAPEAQVPQGIAILDRMIRNDPEGFQAFASTEQGQEFVKNALTTAVPTIKDQVDIQNAKLRMAEFMQGTQEFNVETDLKRKELLLKKNELTHKKLELDQKKALSDLDRDSNETLKYAELSTRMQIQVMKDRSKLAEIEAKKKDTTTSQANTYRKEFIKAVQTHQERIAFYNQAIGSVAEGDATGIGDIALVFTFMKMLDPRSVVRESEQGIVIEAAGIEPRMKNIMESILRGKLLNPDLRASILERVNVLYNQSLQVHDHAVGVYTRLSRKSGVDPELVIIPSFEGFDLTTIPDSVLAKSPKLRALVIKQLEEQTRQ